jgi:predicted porin
MYKRSLLAVTLFCAFTVSTHAQSSVALYGLIDTGLIYTNNQLGHSNWQEVTSSTQNTVFGLKEQKIWAVAFARCSNLRNRFF